jgi:hypothetical protein
MKKQLSNISLAIILILITVFFAPAIQAEASGIGTEDDPINTLKYYIGEVVNAGKDTGYSEEEFIDEKDRHYGWELGSFFVSGYTRVTTDQDNNPIFLKNVGDKVALNFVLYEAIDQLNKEEDLYINEDVDGYDTNFGIEKTNFGHGTLIIRHTDYQNASKDPIIYTDYLTSLELGAETKVELFEEGDYEVALDYEIKKDGFVFFDSYDNYRISFKFSVRNGNCMVYPFDVSTGAELTNTAITENGFYLDLAKSRYLDIDVKKEVLKDGADGLTEDVRFNKPAKDGDEYTDEGIYTFTVTNRYTGQQTTKRIYVGANEILKAHMTTGYSITEINKQLEEGATINTDGTINEPPEIIKEELIIEAEEIVETEEEETTDEIIIVPVEDITETEINSEHSEMDNDSEILNEQIVSRYEKIILVLSIVSVMLFIIVILLLVDKLKKTKINKGDN